MCCRGLVGVLVVTVSGWASAQSDWARVAVPSYNPIHLMQGLHGHWTAPRADEFAAEARALVPALQPLCEAPAGADRLRAARSQWRSTTTAWERLSAVALGPVIERRSIRQIDFTPTRPALIEKAIAAAPQGAAFERIGTPAKGLPALEWLLWTKPALLTAGADAPACRYAVELAREVEREAAALQAAFRQLADRKEEDWDDEAAVAGMNEFVNQWVGGIERLRWPQMEKPLRSGAKGELPRAASGSTATSWAAHWQALQALAVFKGGAAPAPGAGLIPLETYLRGRGRNPLADRLVQAGQRVESRLGAVTQAGAGGAARPKPAQVMQVARELAGLKRLAEAELAPALEVSIGFSDADGD